MTFYMHDATGRITHTAVPADRAGYRAVKEAEGALFVEDLGPPKSAVLHYVDGGKVLPKAPLPLDAPPASVPADGQTLARITGAPAGTRVIVDDVEQGTTDGGPIETSFATGGRYRFVLVHPHYLPRTFVVAAEPVGGGA